MNDSSDVEAETPFTAAFPLPFRVLFLAGIGILGWATNLHGLDVLGVDAVSAMDLRTHEGHLPKSLAPGRSPGFRLISEFTSHYSPIYRLFTAYAVWCFLSWFLFLYATRGDMKLVDVFGYIPAVSALCILGILICPFNVLQKRERDMFLDSIRRCLFSPMDSPVYFADVIFADIFTSFAKVLGDVWLSLCMLLPGSTLLVSPTQEGWSRWIFPAIMSLPYLVRLRQCIIEYASPQNESRRPLLNALKYATSFPVIFLSAGQRIVATELTKQSGDSTGEDAWRGEHHLFRLWLLAAAVNSLYSFWWDVTNDWGLDLLKPRSMVSEPHRDPPPRRLVLPALHSSTPLVTRSSLSLSLHNDAEPFSDSGPTNPHNPYPSHHHNPYPYGLRPTLLYPLPVYPLVIFLNLILRLTWSIKLSSHLHSKSEGSVTIFWLEVAEIVRRWMWVFVRVEWEVIKLKLAGVKGWRGGLLAGTVDSATSGDEDDEYELARERERDSAVDLP